MFQPGYVALGGRADAPTAAGVFVFEAGEDVEGAADVEGVVVAGEAVEVGGDRPLRAQVDLVDFVAQVEAVVLQVDGFVAAVAVAQAEGFAVFGAVADAGGDVLEAGLVFVEVDDGVGVDAAADFAVGKGDPVGAGAFVLADAAVEEDVVVFEVEFLADAGAQAFRAAVAVEVAGLQGGGEAVGGVDAVLAGVEVFAEELAVAEAVFGSVEVGQVVCDLVGM